MYNSSGCRCFMPSKVGRNSDGKNTSFYLIVVPNPFIYWPNKSISYPVIPTKNGRS